MVIKMVYKDLKKRRETKRKYRKDHPEQFRESSRRYRKAHPEKKRESDRNYHKAHPEYRKTYRKSHLEDERKYWKEHPEKRRAKNKKYYDSNREKHREKVRKYCKAYPEKIRSTNKKYRKSHHEKIILDKIKRREKLNNVIREYTLQEWKNKLNAANGFCPGYEREPHFVGKENLTLDHTTPISKVPVGFVYTINDIQPLCKSCNSRKQAKIIEEIEGEVQTKILMNKVEA